MIVKNAEFIKSATTPAQCPGDQMPEYAFIGRSNVGKSSLINMLLQHKGLAKTSASPGKTQVINFFKVNNGWHVVDLPGYGYAKVSQTQRDAWKKMIWEYITTRQQLMCVFVLIDIRIEPQKSDIAFINQLGEAGIPLCIAFTKTDKVSKSTIPKLVAAHKKEYLNYWEELPMLFITSAENKAGREELLEFIEKANHDFGKE